MSLPTCTSLVRCPDYELFEAWFAGACPLPRTRSQRGNWKYKKAVAWVGWRGARCNPEIPMPANSLTSMNFTRITPEMIMGMRTNAELGPEDWREIYTKAGLHPK